MSVFVQLEFPHDCPHSGHDGGPCDYQAGGIRQYRRHLVVRHGLGLSTRGRRVIYRQLDAITAERCRYLQANRQGGCTESRREFRRCHPVARRPSATDSDESSSVRSATASRRRPLRPADYRSTPTSSEHLSEGGRRMTLVSQRVIPSYGRKVLYQLSSRRSTQSRRASGGYIVQRRRRSRTLFSLWSWSWSTTLVLPH